MVLPDSCEQSTFNIARSRRNLKMLLEYDGTDFAGWQRQPQNLHQKTIQGEIESVLCRVLQEPVELIAAGRTDAGVHAKAQVANFLTENSLSISRLKHALNGLLPSQIKIIEIEDAPENFNARFDAKSRTYRYFLLTRYSALLSRFTGIYRYDFDARAMNACCQEILGQHDFTSFSKAGSQTKTRICTIEKARWYQRKNGLMLEIRANRFLHSMVRLLVGTMIKVGNGELSVQDFDAIFSAKDVCLAATSAQPQGLFLWHVEYKSA
ncbi:tRNA pseudouridine synthase A [Chloroherpeton thalassium ATCC 35110]|uniref:tRNA pseudouridine synthase A n=1 Tax=Chloroherpeton thalassium (strain ATCC 35110 / GB-78) TaxID=517418 RepID=B3QUL0_CHLT3|nr:tRNA pseudouridine(38-40) synthase TruA [Chloroherpeton thalassium]ACF12916.1 tRNA pseudouridine synthase A [Chloroherpeton thalassium ATCC 35110]